MPVNSTIGSPFADTIDIAALVPLFPGDPWDVMGAGGDDSIVAIPADTTLDTLTGGDGNDVILGNNGANLLQGDNPGGGGLPGRDTIMGGNEAGGLGDVIYGGAGGDKLDGQGGFDSVSGGNGNDLVYGGDGNDVLSGDAGADRLWGGNGDDEMHGGTGADRMQGDAGDDKLDGGSENDTLVGGAGNDLLQGDLHNDSLAGQAGNDTILGGGDEDRLHGGTGRDQLTGGAGLDRFIWLSATERGDTVTDFAGDLVQLSKAGFGLASAVGGPIAAGELGLFGGFGAADASGAHIGLVATAGGVMMVYNPTAAAGDMVRIALFTGGAPAGVADFEIIA